MRSLVLCLSTVALLSLSLAGPARATSTAPAAPAAPVTTPAKAAAAMGAATSGGKTTGQAATPRVSPTGARQYWHDKVKRDGVLLPGKVAKAQAELDEHGEGQILATRGNGIAIEDASNLRWGKTGNILPPLKPRTTKASAAGAPALALAKVGDVKREYARLAKQSGGLSSATSEAGVTPVSPEDAPAAVQAGLAELNQAANGDGTAQILQVTVQTRSGKASAFVVNIDHDEWTESYAYDGSGKLLASGATDPDGDRQNIIWDPTPKTPAERNQ